MLDSFKTRRHAAHSLALDDWAVAFHASHLINSEGQA